MSLTSRTRPATVQRVMPPRHRSTCHTKPIQPFLPGPAPRALPAISAIRFGMYTSTPAADCPWRTCPACCLTNSGVRRKVINSLRDRMTTWLHLKTLTLPSNERVSSAHPATSAYFGIHKSTIHLANGWRRPTAMQKPARPARIATCRPEKLIISPATAWGGCSAIP